MLETIQRICQIKHREACTQTRRHITLDKLGMPYELGQKITLQWRKDLNSEEITTSTFTLSGYWDGNSAVMASMAWVSEAFVQSQ